MKKGFTIIELIISIFILSIGIVGIFSSFSMVVILTSDSSRRLTASYLAQEGMEVVRNIRDTNWLYMDAGIPAGTTWVSGLGVDDTPSCDKGCELDYKTTNTSIKPWPAGNIKGDYLYIDVSGFYNKDASGSATKFKRKVIITPVTDVDGKSDHIVKVKVEVAWDQKATILNPSVLAGDALQDDCQTYKNNCVIAEGTLYDWYNYVR